MAAASSTNEVEEPSDPSWGGRGEVRGGGVGKIRKRRRDLCGMSNHSSFCYHAAKFGSSKSLDWVEISARRGGGGVGGWGAVARRNVYFGFGGH